MPLEPITTVPHLPPRPRDAHKGDFGRVLVVGGSRGMVGAVALAANAALRGGAGMTTFAAPQNVQLTIARLCPCATSVPLRCDRAGRLSVQAARQLAEAARSADVLAVGPGMAVGQRQGQMVRAALRQERPVVLDADGLNNLARMKNWPALRRCGLVLTPHPGEFSRLTGRSIADVQADRQNTAAAAARRWAEATEGPPLLCVLKGASTVVTDGAGVYVNETGNPGMATGGSGDVLTGLIAALIGQGMALFEAACLGVWAHGRAGDIAAERLGCVGLMATDILEALPAAMKEAAS